MLRHLSSLLNGSTPESASAFRFQQEFGQRPVRFTMDLHGVSGNHLTDNGETYVVSDSHVDSN